MSCADYAHAIHALVDGTLDEAGRHELEAHLTTCAACRTLAADLREIRRAGADLEPLAPPAVWPRLASRLREQIAAASPASRRGAWSAGARWLAVAATLVLAAGAALVLLRVNPFRMPPAPGPTVPSAATTPSDASPDELVQRVEAELTAAERHYEAALANLERMAESGEPRADAQVARTLRQNVGLVDRAIADSRAALQSDPQSQPARESLFEALRRKVALLQDTIALVNEMRKGNQAATAAIAEGIKKS